MPSALSYAIPGAMNAQNRGGYDSTMKGLIDQYNYLYPTVQDEQDRDAQNRKANESPILGSPAVFGGEYEYRRNANDESALADVVSKLRGHGGVERTGGGSFGGGAHMAPPQQGGGYDAVSEQEDRDQQNYWLGQAHLRSANAGASIAEDHALDATFGPDERRQNAVGDAALAGQAAVANYNATEPIREGQEAAQERLFRERYGDPAQIRADAGVQEAEINAQGRVDAAGVPRTTNTSQSRTTIDPGKQLDALTKYRASLRPDMPAVSGFGPFNWGGRDAQALDGKRISSVDQQIESIIQGLSGGTTETQTNTEQQEGIPITLEEAKKVQNDPKNLWTDEELQRRMKIHGYYITQ